MTANEVFVQRICEAIGDSPAPEDEAAFAKVVESLMWLVRGYHDEAYFASREATDMIWNLE